MQSTFIEKSLSKYYENYHIQRTSSGTSALIAILKTLKAGSSKKEVIIPSVVCPSVMFAVNFLNLKTIFVDMEKKYFNMCIKNLKKKITKNTLAIIGVHCFGLAADIQSLISISKRKKIFLIEDACLNFGGKYQNKYFGSFGDASILSFGYDKILSESGGAVMVKSKKKFLSKKNFLKSNPEFLNFNFNKNNFKKKFDQLEETVEKRKENAKKYFNNLNSKDLIKPQLREEDVYWRYPVIFKKDREKLIKRADRRGLIITKHYPAVSNFQTKSDLKIANLMNKSIINFFVKPETSSKYIKKICSLFINEK